MTTTTPVNPLGSHYPATWEEFRGQREAVELLQDTTASARSRGEVMDHILLASPLPGIGKTSLASLTAMYVGRNMQISGGNVGAPEARILLQEMDDNHIWLIDEFHGLFQGGPKRWAWLLHVMQDGVIPGPRGAMEEVPSVTIIGTTTEVGKIPQPILQRFQVRPQFVPYSDGEGADIALELALRVGIEIDDATAVAVATAASNHPRTTRNVLSVMRDAFLAGRFDAPDGRYVDSSGLLPEIVYRRTGLRSDGLYMEAVTYLQELRAARGTPIGERALEGLVGLRGDAFSTLELSLIGRGLVTRTSKGRQLTILGIQKCRELSRAVA